MHTCQFSWLPFSRLGTSPRLVSQVLNSPPDSVVMLSQPFWIHSISVGIGIAESEQLIQKRGLLPTVLDAVVTTPPHLLWEGPPNCVSSWWVSSECKHVWNRKVRGGEGPGSPFCNNLFRAPPEVDHSLLRSISVIQILASRLRLIPSPPSITALKTKLPPHEL